jgi:hypothetical protein
MNKQVQIPFSYENGKEISSFSVDFKDKQVNISVSDFETITNLCADLNIKDQANNLCSLLFILGEERKNRAFDNPVLVKQITANKEAIRKDRIEVARFAKEMRSGNVKEYVFHASFHYKMAGKSSFKIFNPSVIDKLMKIINDEYAFESSLKDNYEEMLSKEKQINSAPYVRKKLASRLNSYLGTHTSLSKNKRYFLIGSLFQLSGHEDGLSYEHFSKRGNSKIKQSEKSYTDFVTTQIRAKYFPGGKGK